MKKYLRNITVGTALVLVAGSCTGNFEEYNTNQFQIHEADPSTLMKSMIETIVNIQQNDSQMMDQMVGQLGGYLTCANVWSGTNFGTFNQSDAWNAGPWNTNFEKIYGNFFQIQEATNESGHYYAFARMIRAITMLRVADCYGPMPYSQVKKGNFYVAYDTEEQVYKNKWKILQALPTYSITITKIPMVTHRSPATTLYSAAIMPTGQDSQIPCD